MTYIEFFDRISSENICACLTYAPDRVIYLGDDSKVMDKHVSFYDQVFKERGCNIEFSYRTVFKGKIDQAVEVLTELVNSYDDCVFDVTGGDEMLILALGAVCQSHPEKNIQVHKFNLRNNVIYDFDRDGNTVFHRTPSLSIEENVAIYGGKVVYGSIEEDKTYKWDLNAEFLKDIDLIWNICKENVRYWNTQISVFEAAERVGDVSEDGLSTTVSMAALEHDLHCRGAKYKFARGIVNYLLKQGLLSSFECDDLKLCVSYKNKQVKKCLTKAGQALEMKIFILAKECRDKKGQLMYNDALNGVAIDWDGELHDEKTENEYDTENEVDIMLMHDVVPIFISCKNGVVSSNELYKLSTVAERFGGQYSKKVLVATSISDFGEQGEYLRQRAEDMNIKLIEKVQEMDDVKLQNSLKSLWNN